MKTLSHIALTFTERNRLLLAVILFFWGLSPLVAATSIQVDLENWQYRWGDSPFVDGEPVWTQPHQIDHVDWHSIEHPAYPPDRQGRNNIWYRTTLPDVRLVDPVVFITSIDLIAEVYLDQQLLYRFGQFDEQGTGEYAGWPWHMINLPDDFADKTLYFRLYSDYTDIGLWGEKKLLERSSALLNILNNSHSDLIIAAFFFFIALLAFAFAAMQGDKRQFAYLGLFSLASAGNLLGESQALQLLIYAPLAKTYLAAISYFATPIFIALLLHDWIGRQTSKLMLRVAQMHMAYVLICLLLSLTGIRHLAYFYPVFDGLFVLTLLVMTWFCIRHIKAMNVEQRMVMGAFGVYAIFFLVDMVVAHGWVNWFNFPLAYGGLFFALVLVVISLKKYHHTQQAVSDLNIQLERRVAERTASLESYVKLEQQRANQLAMINDFSLNLGNLIHRLQRTQSLHEAVTLICQELHQVFSPLQVNVTLLDDEQSIPATVKQGQYQIEVEDLQFNKKAWIRFELLEVSAANTEVANIIDQFSLRAADRLTVTLSSIKLREDLHVMSFEDALTGLKNRRFLDEALQRELLLAERHRQAISLLICDIDNFKQFNDLYGHQAGDLALRSVALLMIEHFRDTDIPCRYGGEEFVVLMPSATQNDALERAKSLLQKVANQTIFYHDQNLGHLTISIGINSWDGQGAIPHHLLHEADKALYKAKQSGRNRIEVAN